MIIPRKYLSEMKVANPMEDAFLPAFGRPRNRSKAKGDKSTDKNKPNSHSKSLSFDLLHQQYPIGVKGKQRYRGYSQARYKVKQKLKIGNSSLQSLSETVQRTRINSFSYVSPQYLPSKLLHLQQLHRIQSTLNSFVLNNQQSAIERECIQYYSNCTLIQHELQQFSLLFRKEFSMLINLERMLIIVLLDMCYFNQISSYSKHISDAVGKILQQYKRFENQKNKGDDLGASSIKIKMKTPGLIIKAENYKIFDGFRKIVGFSHMAGSLKELQKKIDIEPSEFWYILREFYAYHMSLMHINKTIPKKEFWPIMTAPSPYLPQYHGYTLVLDLDETLAHYSADDNKVFVRPYVNQFLLKMKRFYEIVLFTAGMPDYAEYLLNFIHEKQCISHKLFRYHTTRVQPDKTIKDLERLGRPLNRMIIVDNMSHNFERQVYNGIEIPSWYGQEDDNELEKLSRHLVKMVQEEGDLRQYVQRHLTKQ